MIDKPFMGPSPQAAFLPTPEQQWLVQACVFDGQEAVAAWQSWRAAVDPSNADAGSIRLLPLLADKLDRLGIADPALATYRGVQRRTWLRNQMLFRGAAKMVERFQKTNIPVMALKGIVLATAYYDSMSLRPMGDLDFLVRLVDAPKALDQLEALGWRRQGDARPREAAEFALRYACAFEDPTNSEVSIDLHWRLYWAQRSEEAETALWQRAIPFPIGGLQCLAPCSADMLLHICAHGARWNVVPPLRWIVDAMLLLRTRNIDWTYVCAQSERFEVNLHLADTLQYLRVVMHAPIPEQVLEGLMRRRAQTIDRFLYETELHPPEQRSLLAALRIHWHIARSHLKGLYNYWRFLSAMRGERNFGEMIAWARRWLIPRWSQTDRGDVKMPH